jgi:hypothetical protein
MVEVSVLLLGLLMILVRSERQVAAQFTDTNNA